MRAALLDALAAVRSLVSGGRARGHVRHHAWTVGRLNPVGTHAWINWRAFDPAAVAIEDSEGELHSDREFVGGPASFGPYALTPIMRGSHSVGESVILHEAIHTNLSPEVVIDGKLAKADSSAYHGGTIGDEIAALVSLELGVRLRYAGMRQTSGIRYPDDEPRSPITFEVPRLVRPGPPDLEILPRVMHRPASLNRLELLPSFPKLDEGTQAELVRAARAYAGAIWWANEDPNQAWLQLVTAVETAAKCRQTVSASSVELIEELWPELWAVMDGADDATRFSMSELVAPQMKATRTFLDFVTECAPTPPDPRPEFPELDWDRMRKHARTIYTHRSNALHEAKPFPAPMLEFPAIERSGAIQEAPFGLNSGALGGVWDAKETPMLLSTFEYIARGALLHWWAEMDTSVKEEGRERNASDRPS